MATLHFAKRLRTMHARTANRLHLFGEFAVHIRQHGFAKKHVHMAACMCVCVSKGVIVTMRGRHVLPAAFRLFRCMRGKAALPL